MWQAMTRFDKHEVSRRTVLRGATSVSLMPLSSLLTDRATADAHWITSEHPAFSVGATIGGLTFVAQDASDRGSLPAATAAQAERTLDNLRLALASAGQSLDNVVFLHVMLSDYREALEVARLVQAAFGLNVFPPTCFIGVSDLRNPPGRLVRMDAIATTISDRAQIVVPACRRRSARAFMRCGWVTCLTGAVDAAAAPLDATVPPSAVILIALTSCCAA